MTDTPIPSEDAKKTITSILSTILKDFKNNLVDPGIIDDLRNKIKVKTIFIKYRK